MKASEIITEARVTVRDQIIQDVEKHGPGEYFVRFTNADKLGYSARQTFGYSPDVGDPEFDVDRISAAKQGRPVLWFYPLKEYLKANDYTYATNQPYVWLIKLKPDAWLQTVGPGDRKKQSAPAGKQRVGLLRMSTPPAAMFFEPGFDVIGRYYDYGAQHQRHGQVKGAPQPTFFDRVRGIK